MTAEFSYRYSTDIEPRLPSMHWIQCVTKLHGVQLDVPISNLKT